MDTLRIPAMDAAALEKRTPAYRTVCALPRARGLTLASTALASVLLAGTAAAQGMDGINEQRERAVAAARSGQLDQAITELRRLDAEAKDVRSTHDLIVVLTWAGRHFSSACAPMPAMSLC